MKTRTALTAAELYALERAARRARSQEVARLIRAAAGAFVFVSQARRLGRSHSRRNSPCVTR